MAEAAADAAGAAVDRVADAEALQRSSSDGASTSGAWDAPEAVLQQRTYFAPTMVSLPDSSPLILL